jgi:urate oxidase
VRFSLPNKHHFVIDLSPFGLDNPNEVFHADDRPYGYIEGTVRRQDAPDPELAFDPGQGW